MLGLAMELAHQSPVDPKTLTRAARAHAEKDLIFAAGVAFAAVRWLAEGFGYEITGLDVLAAYHTTLNGGGSDRPPRADQDCHPQPGRALRRELFRPPGSGARAGSAVSSLSRMVAGRGVARLTSRVWALRSPAELTRNNLATILVSRDGFAPPTPAALSAALYSLKLPRHKVKPVCAGPIRAHQKRSSMASNGCPEQMSNMNEYAEKLMLLMLHPRLTDYNRHSSHLLSHCAVQFRPDTVSCARFLPGVQDPLLYTCDRNP